MNTPAHLMGQEHMLGNRRRDGEEQTVPMKEIEGEMHDRQQLNGRSDSSIERTKETYQSEPPSQPSSPGGHRARTTIGRRDRCSVRRVELGIGDPWGRVERRAVGREEKRARVGGGKRKRAADLPKVQTQA
jgi:hypothetical protein